MCRGKKCEKSLRYPFKEMLKGGKTSFFRGVAAAVSLFPETSARPTGPSPATGGRNKNRVALLERQYFYFFTTRKNPFSFSFYFNSCTIDFRSAILLMFFFCKQMSEHSITKVSVDIKAFADLLVFTNQRESSVTVGQPLVG